MIIDKDRGQLGQPRVGQAGEASRLPRSLTIMAMGTQRRRQQKLRRSWQPLLMGSLHRHRSSVRYLAWTSFTNLWTRNIRTRYSKRGCKSWRWRFKAWRRRSTTFVMKTPTTMTVLQRPRPYSASTTAPTAHSLPFIISPWHTCQQSLHSALTPPSTLSHQPTTDPPSQRGSLVQAPRPCTTIRILQKPTTQGSQRRNRLCLQIFWCLPKTESPIYWTCTPKWNWLTWSLPLMSPNVNLLNCDHNHTSSTGAHISW